ncbi:importin beta-like SAD2 [Impatiens glandulifera]|uniref:importin beta-like SAD2 n=1 Tax=Impatiens glandulifera TaxID=253017 RepID=UPI001FB18592|nr:importin beta-like SAD2 [Impatiens glandulifera]
MLNRTLLDSIRDDPNTSEGKKSWKVFRDKLRLRRAGAAWISSVPTPTSDVNIPTSNRLVSRRGSGRFPGNYTSNSDLMSNPSGGASMMRRNSSRQPSLATSRYNHGMSELTHPPVEGQTMETIPRPRVRFQLDDELDDDEDKGSHGENDEEGEGGDSQQSTSLMSLLMDGSSYLDDDDEDEDEDEDGEEEERKSEEFNTCCVCMVRHNGAAFVPCGHSFCRMCSRELWVQRGNCPLCNGFICEILEIF